MLLCTKTVKLLFCFEHFVSQDILGVKQVLPLVTNVQIVKIIQNWRNVVLPKMLFVEVNHLLNLNKIDYQIQKRMRQKNEVFSILKPMENLFLFFDDVYIFTKSFLLICIMLFGVGFDSPDRLYIRIVFWHLTVFLRWTSNFCVS